MLNVRYRFVYPCWTVLRGLEIVHEIRARSTTCILDRQKQYATGNPVPVPVPVDPVIFSDSVPIRFRQNTDRIDRIKLSPGFDIM